MTSPANITATDWTSFVGNILPYLTIFGLTWKGIDKVFEYFGKRGKEATLEVVKDFVTPQIDNVEKKLDGLKTEHQLLKSMLEDALRKK